MESSKLGTRTEREIDEVDSQESSRLLKLQEETGDIFDAPTNTLIIHACNCEGHWGAGIAKAFKDLYPQAHQHHEEYCQDHSYSLIDSAQLIPPLDASSNDGGEDKKPPSEASDGDKEAKNIPETPKHFIGCLFTSRRYGRKKDTPKRILQATKPAMEDLLRQVNDWNAKAKKEEDKIKEVRMCKINSGLFAVPWEKSKKELESIEVKESDVKMIKVVSRAEE